MTDAGILHHISALPSEYGIGDLGPQAYQFIDQLVDAKQTYWQILPLNYPDELACPYAAYSAFGGNIYLISPEILLQENLIDEIAPYEDTQSDKVVFYKVREYKRRLLHECYKSFLLQKDIHSQLRSDYQKFINESQFWIDDFSLFLCLTDRLGTSWQDWPVGLKNKEEDAINQYRQLLAKDIEFHKFCQFLFHQQWKNLKNYANDKGIKIIGDMPIYVSTHSMDVWSWNEGFQLNSDGSLKYESGAPPDDFSDEGQKWSTPTYNWHFHQEQNFFWWVKRIEYNLSFFNILRLDHFLGFINLWHIPAKQKAIQGEWVKTPGRELLQTLEKHFPEMPFIAEDLGVVSDEVRKLRDDFELPGMKILQFAFTTDEKNEYLPQNYENNCLAYTGTHDNNTVIGYLDDLKSNPPEALSKEIQNIENFFNLQLIQIDNWDFIQKLFMSKANTVIIQLQDLFGLDGEARFNLPGTIENNWVWRYVKQTSHDLQWKKLRELTMSTGRNS